MDNCLVFQICTQIEKAAERISELGNAIQTTAAEAPVLSATFENQCYDEVAHLQQLVLALTDIVLPAENADEGGAFAEGELTDDIGDKTDCEQTGTDSAKK